VIFWVGDELEAFLAKPLRSIPKRAEIVALGGIQGLTQRNAREGGVWEARENKGDAHAHGERDMHLWLDPVNAKAMARAIARALRRADPENALKYKANGERLEKRLDALDQELAAKLGPVKRVPFIVFHDAYQYFEKRYGLNGAGTITVSPDRRPGAKRLSKIRATIRSRQAACVFAEPQFRPALVKSVVAGTEVRTGLLDPLGADLPAEPDMYFHLMRGLADSLSKCLSSKPRGS
jgi:zinc transport system substrate-binding protein